MSSKNLWQDFLDQRIDPKDVAGIRRFFEGKHVIANYGNNKPYTLEDVNFSLKPEAPFPDPKF